ncbi:rhodanese-like domain-containing protein, partial [Bacteroides heparinolyticus]
QPMSKETFIAKVLDGLMPPPAYFPENVRMNIKGYTSIDEVLSKGTQALSPAEFEATANDTHALLLDTRSAEDFARGFIPNSINIGVDGNFAPWVGALIPDIKQPILLIADEGRAEEIVTRLARVGYDNAIGFLQGGFEAWEKEGREVDSIPRVTADELADRLAADPALRILDVRKQSEHLSEHVIGSENMALDYINQHTSDVSKDKTYYVHCAGGYRSMIFISILRARGYNNLIDIQGGFAALKATGRFPISDFVCPTTML